MTETEVRLLRAAHLFVEYEPIRRTGRLFFPRRRIESAFAEHWKVGKELERAEEEMLAERGWSLDELRAADVAWAGIAWTIRFLTDTGRLDEVLPYVERAVAAESLVEMNRLGLDLVDAARGAHGG